MPKKNRYVYYILTLIKIDTTMVFIFENIYKIYLSTTIEIDKILVEM